MRALGARPEAVAALEATLQNEAARLPEIALASPDALAAALRREPDCLSRLSCAAAAAARAGAARLVSGTVSELGDAFMLDLKLVDSRSGQELRRVTHPVSGRQDLLIEVARAAAVELLAPARYRGRLSVRLLGEDPDVVAPEIREQAAKGKGARLFLDGAPAGTLPLAAPLEDLTVGQHTLRVAQEGFQDATLFVEVRYGRTTEAFVDLERGALAGVAFLREKEQPRPPPGARADGARPAAPAQALAAAPPRGPWLKIAGWSGVGVGALALLGGAVFHTKAYATANSINRREASLGLSEADLASYNDVDKAVAVARALYVVSGVCAAVGAGLLVWDFREEQRGAAATARSVQVVPAGAGAALAARF